MKGLSNNTERSALDKRDDATLEALGVACASRRIAAKWQSRQVAGDNQNETGASPHNNSEENQQMSETTNGVTPTATKSNKPSKPQAEAQQIALPPMRHEHVIKLPPVEVAKATATGGAVIIGLGGLVLLGAKILRSSADDV